MTFQEDEIPLILLVAAGCLAGAIETLVTWPMEYIKTQLQLHQKHEKPHAAVSTTELSGKNEEIRVDNEQEEGIFVTMFDDDHASSTTPPFNSMIPGIIYTIRTLGCCALYTGLFPILLGAIPKAGIRFGLDAWLGELLLLQSTDGADNGSMLAIYFISGLIAGIVEALIVVAPVETIKTKCIELNMNFFDGFREIVRSEGIQGIYSGVLATVLKQGSNQALRFVWYHQYKHIIISHHSNNHDDDVLYDDVLLYISATQSLTAPEAFIGGVTAGIFSALGNQPFDTLKTRMQGVQAKTLYSSTWDCVCKTYHEQGVCGFYTGIIPRLARVVPGQGIIFMAFEMIVEILVLLFAE